MFYEEEDYSSNGDPAKTIVRYLGGVKHFAHMFNMSEQGVYRIFKPKPKGGGGLFSSRLQREIMKISREKNISLMATDFFDPSRLRAIMQFYPRSKYCLICNKECDHPRSYSDVWWMVNKGKVSEDFNL